jgi:D-psicose/D-tagatose/L-ribulose 3-epimerase
MKCGVQSWLWTTCFREKDLPLFDKIHKMGYDGLEIHLEYLEMLPINEIKRKKNETGLACTFSAGLTNDKNVASPQGLIRERGIIFLKKAIEVAATLEGDIICGILYGVWGEQNPKMRKPEELEYAAESLRVVGDYARDHGITLALEPVNRFEGYMINTAEEMANFLDKVNHPNVKMLLDTFQMNFEENNLCEPFRKYAKYVHHIHLCENHRGVPGTGTMPWKNIFKTLKEIGYNRWVVYEAWATNVFLSELGEIPPKIAMWRRLITNNDAAAEQALKFFKQMEKEA